MKKIIISISIILVSCIVAIGIVFVVNNSKKEIILTSPDGQVTINLGKNKVSQLTEDYQDGSNQIISFKVESSLNFYNTISTCEFFRKDMDYKIQGYYAYGFLEKNGHFFLYSIKDNNVQIIAIQGTFESDSDTYYIPLPVKCNITEERLTSEGIEQIYYKTLCEEHITFEIVLTMLKYIDSKFFEYDGERINLKGVSGINLLDGNIIYSNNYLLSIINKERAYVELYVG